MIMNLEQIKESIQQLPPVERENLKEWLNNGKTEKTDQEEKANRTQLAEEQELFRQSLDWIQKHREEYDGQWVALYGSKLLAHGTDGKAVHAEAKTKTDKTPLMHRVSVKELMPFGGW